MSVFLAVLQTLRTSTHSRVALQLEILTLRHQLQVVQRTRPRRLRLATTDRSFWVMLSRLWSGWRTSLVLVKPETVIAWHRRGFRPGHVPDAHLLGHERIVSTPVSAFWADR